MAAGISIYRDLTSVNPAEGVEGTPPLQEQICEQLKAITKVSTYYCEQKVHLQLKANPKKTVLHQLEAHTDLGQTGEISKVDTCVFCLNAHRGV